MHGAWLCSEAFLLRPHQAQRRWRCKNQRSDDICSLGALTIPRTTLHTNHENTGESQKQHQLQEPENQITEQPSRPTKSPTPKSSIFPTYKRTHVPHPTSHTAYPQYLKTKNLDILTGTHHYPSSYRRRDKAPYCNPRLTQHRSETR